MGQLTLVEAAIHYHNDEYGNPRGRTSIDLTEVQHANNIQTAFKAGAEWQKEQYKELIKALKELVECDYTSGTHLSCALIRGRNALISIGETI